MTSGWIPNASLSLAFYTLPVWTQPAILLQRFCSLNKPLTHLDTAHCCCLQRLLTQFQHYVFAHLIFLPGMCFSLLKNHSIHSSQASLTFQSIIISLFWSTSRTTCSWLDHSCLALFSYFELLKGRDQIALFFVSCVLYQAVLFRGGGQ